MTFHYSSRVYSLLPTLRNHPAQRLADTNSIFTARRSNNYWFTLSKAPIQLFASPLIISLPLLDCEETESRSVLICLLVQPALTHASTITLRKFPRCIHTYRTDSREVWHRTKTTHSTDHTHRRSRWQSSGSHLMCITRDSRQRQ